MDATTLGTGFALFNLNGFYYLIKWLHIFFGIIWIGHLYYFNFVQGAFFAETDAATKSNAIQKLLPRALWWFRWGAMWTFVTGLTLLSIKGHQGRFEIYTTSWGVTILIGSALATLMWFNVWFVIWPKQQIVIASATKVASGGQADPNAAGAAARALITSRTNVMFSIPMIFYMSAASSIYFGITENSRLGLLTLIIALLLGVLEWHALKGSIEKSPLKTIKGVITCGFGLAILLYAILEFTIRLT